MTWQKLSSTIKYQNNYMTVTDDEIVTAHGDHVTYGIVHKEPFSIIIPWDGEKTLLVGQYRYPVDYFSWEFSMGHHEVKHGSDLGTAKAELQEETGLVAQNLEEIGTFYLASGHHTQVGHVFVANSYAQGSQELEASEKDMQLRWVSLPELESLIANGTIKDGPTITSFKLFELYLKGHHD